MATLRSDNFPFRAVFLLSAVVTILFGCSALQRTRIPPLPENVPGAYELENVPFYSQSAYQCGPATLAMVLTWNGLTVTPEALKTQVYTPARKGSLQIAMVGATRRHGKIAYEIKGPKSLFVELASGRPVIVLQNLGLSWLPVWHYAVVIGYDFSEEIVLLHSGVTERKVMSYFTFDKTWARSGYWGMIVLAPTEIPVLTTENKYLSAVLGLEKSHQYRAAVEGYQTALNRWPQSLTALMGLGNSFYKLGDLPSAENAFRNAADNHPRAGAAYNNLAQVLMEQGRNLEALEAARKAVSLGGPMRTEYESTLQEIQLNRQNNPVGN
jgi:hypothetical protein